MSTPKRRADRRYTAVSWPAFLAAVVAMAVVVGIVWWVS